MRGTSLAYAVRQNPDPEPGLYGVRPFEVIHVPTGRVHVRTLLRSEADAKLAEFRELVLQIKEMRLSMDGEW